MLLHLSSTRFVLQLELPTVPWGGSSCSSEGTASMAPTSQHGPPHDSETLN